MTLLSWDKHASAKHQQIHAALCFSFGSFCFSELSILKITLSPWIYLKTRSHQQNRSQLQPCWVFVLSEALKNKTTTPGNIFFSISHTLNFNTSISCLIEINKAFQVFSNQPEFIQQDQPHHIFTADLKQREQHKCSFFLNSFIPHSFLLDIKNPVSLNSVNPFELHLLQRKYCRRIMWLWLNTNTVYTMIQQTNLTQILHCVLFYLYLYNSISIRKLTSSVVYCRQYIVGCYETVFFQCGLVKCR